MTKVKIEKGRCTSSLISNVVYYFLRKSKQMEVFVFKEGVNFMTNNKIAI